MTTRTLRKVDIWTVLYIVGLVLGINGLLLMAVVDPTILPTSGSDTKLWMIVAGSQLFAAGFVLVLIWGLKAKTFSRSKKVAFLTLLFLLLLALPAIVYSV